MRRRIYLMLLACMSATLAIGQNSYNLSGPTPGQGPLLNNESTSSSTGWTQIHLDTDNGGGSTNSWSDAVDIGFPFEFYGVNVDSFCVSKNYLLTFNTALAGTTLPTSIDDNVALPAAGLPDSTIAYFWGEFANGSAPLGTNDDVWVKTFGSAPNRQLWVKNFSYEADGQSFTYDFVVLEETTNKIYIVDARNATANAGSVTIGVQLNSTTAVQAAGSPNINFINGNTTNPWPNVDYYELTPIVLLPNNISVDGIVHPELPICPGTDSVVVELTNQGTNTIDSVTVTSIANGTMLPAQTITGMNLAPGASTTYNLGTFTFAAGVVYNFQIYTTNPNGVADANPADDTLNLNNIQTGMSGNYTINSGAATSGTNFQSFGDAANALENIGLCGPVVITVTSGSGPYTENFYLGDIPGSDASNTVTVKGNMETLSFNATANDRAIVRLDGTKHVTIDSLNIESTNATYGYGVFLTGEADSNTITNCMIDLTAVTSTSSTNSTGILSSGSGTSTSTAGDNTNYSTFTNNTVIGGYYGIRLNGNSTGIDAVGNVINDNTIREFYAYGVYLDDNDGTEVIGNDISRAQRVAVTTFYGVFLTGGNRSVEVENNLIHNTHDNASSLTGAAYGIYFSGADAPVGEENIAINNLIYNFNGNGTIYALYNSSSNGAFYYHNTISLDHTAATGGTTRGFYQTTTASNIDIRNNIFSITRGGSGVKHGLYFNSTGSTIISENNVIYVNSAGSGAQHIGRYSTDFTILANWQTANSNAYDQNSTDANPLFVDIANDDYTPASGAVNDIGANLGVALDIFGTPRTSTPDPGAIEFTPVNDDAAVTALLSPMAACPGSVDLIVSIGNFGIVTLDSVNISYTVNGGSTMTTQYTGPLAPGVQDTVNLGSITISGSSTDIVVWTSMPNGNADQNTSNDTLSALGIQTALAAGSYTINSGVATGGTNFQSFSDAANVLNSVGICGPVVFDVVSGTGPYVEQLDLGVITGVSANNTVTFNGNGETLTFAATTSDRYIVRLAGSKWVSIDSLNIESTSTTYGYGVLLTNSADSNMITNCTIDLTAVTSTSSTNTTGILASGSATSTSTAGANTNGSTFQGNTVIGGYYGIRLNGNSTGQDAKGNSIIDNDVRDFYAYGVYLDDNDSTLVYANDISRAQRVSVTTFYGVFLTGGNRDVDVRYNRIHNTHDNASSLTGAAYGIYFSGADAPVGQENLAVNNLIYNFNGNGTIYALYNSSSNGAWYYHNTISLDHVAATGGTTRGFYQTTTASNIDIRNNIFSITRGGSGVKHGLYFNTTGSTITSDNNVIYVNSAGSGAQHIGRYSTDQTTLADWQLANSGAYGQASTDLDPIFSDLNNDNYAPNNPGVNDFGANLGVADDIFGAPRGTTPDPGAIEFTPADTNIALLSIVSPVAVGCSFSASDSVEIEVANAGLDTITSFSATYVLNGNTPVTQVFTGGSIPPGTSTNVIFPVTINLSGSFSHTLDVWVSLSGDTITNNDSILGVTLTLPMPVSAPYFEDFETLNNEDFGQLTNGWVGNQTSDPRWEAEDGATSNENSSDTGPFWDHTNEGNSGGIYMFMETSSGGTGQESELVSPCIDLTGMMRPAVSYWYHMYGADMGNLFLDISTDGGQTWTAIDSLLGEQNTSGSDPWKKSGASLCAYIGQTVKFQFRGQRGTGFESDMSIDDFRIFELTSELVDNDTACTGPITLDPGVGFSNYLWSTTATTQTIDVTTSGTYTVTLTDACGNTQTDSTVVSIFNPQVSLVATDVTCNGAADGTVTSTLTGGLAPVAYLWSNAATTANLTGLSGGTYTVTVTDAYGCTATASATVAEPTQLVAAIVVDSNVTCAGFNNGGATASATGGTSPYTYAWSNGATTAAITGVAGGTYSVTVTDANGCTDSSSVTITEPTALVVGAVTDSLSLCGLPQGGVSATVSGGTMPYTYSWSNSGTTASLTGLMPNVYIVTVTDANGCSDTASASTIQAGAIVVTATVDSNVTCNGFSDGGATATASSGTMPYTYNWSNSATTASITGVVAGTYTITVTDGTGCTAVDSVVITEPTVLVAAAIVDSNVSCNGFSDGGATASATGGTGAYTYAWSNSATTASITGVVAGTYSVTITDANGCTDSASVTITEPVVLVASTVVDSNVTCNAGTDGGATASATGGTMPYTYAWSNAATTASITGVAAGTYSVTITDANGCTDSASVTITEPTAVTGSITASTNVSCNGGNDGSLTATAAGGTAPYVYAWSSGGNMMTETGLSAGTYTVTITDANGCGPVIDSMTITEPFAVGVSVTTISDVSCNGGNDGSLMVAGSGGTAPYNYLWSTNDTTTTISGLMAGTYPVTVTDANGCTAVDSGFVLEPLALTLTLTPTDVTCEGGNDGEAAAAVTGGNAPYSYIWDDPANQTTATATGLEEGTYNVTVTDDNGCTVDGNVTLGSINSLPNVMIVASADSVCEDSTITLDAGAGFASYAWSTNETSQTITVDTTNLYIVVVTDANGCQNADSITVTVDGICVGIPELFAGVDVNLFPNPTNGLLNLQIIGLEGEDLTVSVMNMHGQLITETRQDNIAGQYNDQLDLRNQAQGVYFVRLTAQEQSVVYRVTVN